MAEGFTYNFAAKQVDADVLEAIAKLAKEAQLTEKFEALYNGAVIIQVRTVSFFTSLPVDSSEML